MRGFSFSRSTWFIRATNLSLVTAGGAVVTDHFAFSVICDEVNGIVRVHRVIVRDSEQEQVATNDRCATSGHGVDYARRVGHCHLSVADPPVRTAGRSGVDVSLGVVEAVDDVHGLARGV